MKELATLADESKSGEIVKIEGILKKIGQQPFPSRTNQNNKSNKSTNKTRTDIRRDKITHDLHRISSGDHKGTKLLELCNQMEQ